MTTLRRKARALATTKLRGLTDKAGVPAIAHAERVALLTEALGGDEGAVALALLHDVVEDTATTVEEVEELVPGVRPGLVAITRVEGEPYFDYIERVAREPASRLVKVADLIDHLSPSRVEAIPASLVRRYVRALGLVLRTLDTGPSL